jgi:hypothetical protein
MSITNLLPDLFTWLVQRTTVPANVETPDPGLRPGLSSVVPPGLPSGLAGRDDPLVPIPGVFRSIACNRYGFTAASPMSLPDKSSGKMWNPALDNSSRTQSIPKRNFL